MSANEEIVDDIRELDVAKQDDLLQFHWPFPLNLPGVNTTGVECAVLVLRRILGDMPADSHPRAILFGKKDQTAYKVEKEELNRTRALFRYAWHRLPDLAVQSDDALLHFRMKDRQEALLEVIIPDRRMAQNRVSFEALMESDGMAAALWGRSELQPFRDVIGWQENGEKEWQTKKRTAASQPISWKLDRQPRLETLINRKLSLREVNGGHTSMLLSNWPKCLRVKMTTPTSVSMDNVLDQNILSLKGFKLLAEAEVGGKFRLSETQNEYRLVAAVALRLSGEHNDLVYTFDSEGNQIQPSLKESVSYEAPADSPVMVSQAMLYFNRVDLEVLSISSGSESEEEFEDPDDKKSSQMLKEPDPGASTGLTPLSREAEHKLPKNIGPAWRAAKGRFFQ